MFAIVLVVFMTTVDGLCFSDVSVELPFTLMHPKPPEESVYRDGESGSRPGPASGPGPGSGPAPGSEPLTELKLTFRVTSHMTEIYFQP